MEEATLPPDYCGSPEYRERLSRFLARLMPHKYRSPAGAAPDAEMLQAALGAVADRHPGGRLPVSEDPTGWPDEDPRNTWAYEGRLNAPTRTVRLLGRDVAVQQFWSREPPGSSGEEEGPVDHHTTGSALWDSGVVLAHFVTLPVPVLAEMHPRLDSSWDWAGKTVVELGAGLALPSCVAGLLGATALATDGDATTLPMAQANVDFILGAEPGEGSVRVQRLRWGQDPVSELGLELPCDVVLASDVFYVLENAGVWGKLIKTIWELSGPETLILIGLAERGNKPALYTELLRRLELRFELREAPLELLHSTASPGAAGRMDYNTDVGPSRIFSLARRSDQDFHARKEESLRLKQQAQPG